MNRKHGLKVKDIFSFLEVGAFYWRLLILPLVGAFLSFLSFYMNENLTYGDGIHFLSFGAIFYTAFLFALLWIGSDVRDKIFARNAMDFILLWPISKREKLFWMQLRSTWLPGILLILGGIIGSYLMHPNTIGMLIRSLPYGLAVGFFLSILLWKGSYAVLDAGSFVGKVSYREEMGVSFLIFFLCLSPVVLDFLHFYVEIIVSILLLFAGFAYGGSSKQEIQIGAGSDNHNESSRSEKLRDFRILESIQSPLYRYLYYLEWDNVKKPLQSFLINLAGVCFIVLVYYAIGRLFSSNNDVYSFHRALYLSFLVSYSTLLMHHDGGMTNDFYDMTILLPLSPRKKAIADLLKRIIRPTVYTFLNVIGVVLLIGLLHQGLSLMIPQPHLSYGRLTLGILMYTLTFLPLSIAAVSLIDFLLKVLTVTLQGLGFFKVCSLLHRGAFYLYVFPLFFVSAVSRGELSRIEIFLGYRAIILYVGVFFLSQMGLCWTFKKVQVISS